MLKTPEPVVLVGHPFAPIGMGEVLRSMFQALTSVGMPTRILNVYGGRSEDNELNERLAPYLVDRVGKYHNIFCINGDEVAAVLSHLGSRAENGFRIINPAWELSKYPEAWRKEIDKFDEIWAFSKFLHDSLAASQSKTVVHMPLATEPRLSFPLGRRVFGVDEASFVFLFFFDFTSYIERKNPMAVIRAFEHMKSKASRRDVKLVIKLNSSASNPEARSRFLQNIASVGSVQIIDRSMSRAEIRGLHLSADAFVSLHRSEGYGFGMAEAMYYGKPTIGTGYSGNMDFMNSEISRLIDYRLVPVLEGQYPHALGQVWADPNVEQAAELMLEMVEHPQSARALGHEGSRHIRSHFSYKAIGRRYAERIYELET